MENMTKRMAMQAVVDGNVTAEVKEFFTAEIEKMDAANAERREKNAEKSAKNMEAVKAVAAVLTDEAKTASMRVEELEDVIKREDGKTLNVQYMSGIARKAVEAGLAAQVDVKVKGKGVQKGYVAVVAAVYFAYRYIRKAHRMVCLFFV